VDLASPPQGGYHTHVQLLTMWIMLWSQEECQDVIK